MSEAEDFLNPLDKSVGSMIVPSDMRPVAVDLDDTLVTTDMLHEGVVSVILKNPFLLFLIPLWLLRGKAVLKREVARRSSIDVTTVPVNEGLVAWLRDVHAGGRRICLISGSDQTLVDAVAARFEPLFERAIGSDGVTNNVSAAKLIKIREWAGGDCIYAGDGKHDIVVWEGCGGAALVGRGVRLRRHLSQKVDVVGEFPAPPTTLKVLAKALRLHQWAKNLLMFLPLFLSGGLVRPHDILVTVAGFIVFGMMASASYLINDLFDLSADRAHRSKKNRPLASGSLRVKDGVLIVLLVAALEVAVLPFFPIKFVVTSLVYLGVTLAYSNFIKRKAIIDMLALAFLFTIRIVAGIGTAQSAMSPWLLAFSMFFFLSLAAIKRYGECYALAQQGATATRGRGYRSTDGPWLMSMGAASGFCSIIIFFIFLTDANSPMSKYPNPTWLWSICAVLGYWLSRTWLLAGRGEMNDDPVLFAVKDKLSIALGAVCVFVVLMARYL